MSTLASLVALLLAAAPVAAGGPARGGDASADVRAALRSGGRARVVVSLRSPAGVQASAARSTQLARIREGVLRTLLPEELRVTTVWSELPGFAGEVSAAGLERLLGHPDVRGVGLDRPRFAMLEESVTLVRAGVAHVAGYTGRGVTVAVLDTGVDASHPDLRSSIVQEACFCTSDDRGCCPNRASSQTGPGAARDDDGHGTHVTGIITGDGFVAPQGVAPDAQVVAVRVLGRDGGDSSGILSGLDYVLRRHPEVRIVNMSLGGDDHYPGSCDHADAENELYATAFALLRARGALTFVASGNEEQTSGMGSPACITAAVAVGAVYDDQVESDCWYTPVADRVACFSNSSPLLDLLAPGSQVTAAGLGGGVETNEGTSMATPVAAGAAAVLLSAAPGLGPDELQQLLQGTGRSVTDPRNGRATPRVDLAAALQSLF